VRAVVGGITLCAVHRTPPSVDTATLGNSGKLFPPLKLWKSE
jgi:hypothetical protein